jgi:hypothetical protein
VEIFLPPGGYSKPTNMIKIVITKLTGVMPECQLSNTSKENIRIMMTEE